MVALHIKGMDELTTEKDVEKALSEETGNKLVEHMTVGKLRPSYGGTQAVTVRVRKELALGVYSSISISSCRIRHISNGCCRTLQMFSILEYHANSSLFNEFVCKLDFFLHDWASLKRE
jgi:hypothetical protein